MEKITTPESTVIPTTSRKKLAGKYWFDDSCILDMDNFIKNISSLQEKGVRPDLISSIVSNYASKWLPDLLIEEQNKNLTSFEGSPESITSLWMKKKFFVETLVGVLPAEKDSVPCNFLLRLLRAANMVGVEMNYKDELEKRISWQLDQASLKELMIPAFSHTCETLLDIELVVRLLKMFVNLDERFKSGSSMTKVSKLVDSYLAEAAIDANLTMLQFITLAGSLPSHARLTDDRLYRAIDTYLKVHPGLSKEERKTLFSLIDSQKLSTEATFHAAQNERLPVRAVIQVLYSEQTKLNKQFEWSGSFNGSRTPNSFPDASVRCPSKRDVQNHQMEIKKLREDVLRLQNHCNSMQGQIEKLVERKKSFLWRRLAIPLFQSVNVVSRVEESESNYKPGFERQTPLNKAKLKRTPTRWRKSMS